MRQTGDGQGPEDERERRAIARRAREEVVDVLAEALWTLILAGRGPRSMAGIESKPTPEAPSQRSTSSQPTETAGL